MVSELIEPDGQPAGEARRFLASLSTAQDFLASYETTAPILQLAFDDGRSGSIMDIENVPDHLYGYLLDWYDPPGAAHVMAQATVLKGDSPFGIDVSWSTTEDDDLDEGPLLVVFSDGTRLTAMFPTQEEEVGGDSWGVAVHDGSVQRLLESVVSLAQTADLLSTLEVDDRVVGEAVIQLLGHLARTNEPPRGVVREAAGWLWRKVDLFLDEATKTGGKAAGVVAVGAAGLALDRYAPGLARSLKHIIDLASQS